MRELRQRFVSTGSLCYSDEAQTATGRPDGLALYNMPSPPHRMSGVGIRSVPTEHFGVLLTSLTISSGGLRASAHMNPYRTQLMLRFLLRVSGGEAIA